MEIARAEGLLRAYSSHVKSADSNAPASVGRRVGSVESVPLEWSELDRFLPDQGMPRGVIEVRSLNSIGGGTTIALATVRAVHSHNPRSWCAWIDPDGTLYSPGVAMAGVDLNRLVVVRPPRSDLARIAIKIARSQAFDAIVIDLDPMYGARSPSHPSNPRKASFDVFVRKMALLAAEGGSTVLLLTDANIHRSAPLPVSLRLELTRAERSINVRIGKDRFGRSGLAKTVPIDSKPGLQFGAG